MELSSHKLKKLLHFWRKFAKPEKPKFLIYLCSISNNLLVFNMNLYI